MTVATDGIDRNSVSKRITITQINMRDLIVEGVDNKQGLYFVDCTLQPGVVVIPNLGDDWIIERFNERWKLAYRVEKPTDQDPVASLLPGDVRINSTNRVFINGDLRVNGTPVIPERAIKGEEPLDVIDGENKEFSLSEQFTPGSVDVWVNGLRTYDFVEAPEILGLIFDEAPLEGSEIRVDFTTKYPVFTGSQENSSDGHPD